jgi:hypothetical protein
MGDAIERCVLCCSSQITVTLEQRRVMTTACQTCGGVVRIEFDPPDAPELRGRIELLVAPEPSRTFQS